MNRTEFLLVAATATAAPRARTPLAAISAEVHITRDANALLAPFVVGIALRNSARRIVRLEFPTADLFRIDVIKDDAPVWSSLTGHKPIPINRQIDVPPGLTKLAYMTVDGTTDDHRSFQPGHYIVRVAMLGSFGAVIDREIDFAPPISVAEALRLRPGQVMTIAGDPLIDEGYAYLKDATGRVRLSRSLGIRPSGTWVVRGFLDAFGDERVFDVGRFAPAYENTPATPSP